MSEEWLLALMAVPILVRAGCAANNMNRGTRMLFRLAAVVLAVGAMGLVLAPLYPTESWVRPLFVAGVALWMMTDRGVRRTD